MKYYTITVNGNTYNVSVEEGKQTSAAPAASFTPKPATAAAPVASTNQEKPSAEPVAGGSTGSFIVNSPMPGKIVSVKLSVGQTVSKGDVMMILEAMKMENEIVAPTDGTIASINVIAGQSVEAGTILATLN